MLRSTVPQSKSLGRPLGPEPYGNTVALMATLQFGSKVSVAGPVYPRAIKPFARHLLKGSF
jgi:hypothetical protein